MSDEFLKKAQEAGALASTSSFLAGYPTPLTINWARIAKALAFYQKQGFAYIEAPWLVSKEAIGVTIPPGHQSYTVANQELVASAEQSFIDLAIRGLLNPGKYVAATPCFRDDALDEYHQRYFFKVELIELSREASLTAEQVERTRAMANLALQFYRSQKGGKEAYITLTEEGWDIALKGVELGSYGYRRFREWRWIYGTGLAEPRFSSSTLMPI